MTTEAYEDLMEQVKAVGPTDTNSPTDPSEAPGGRGKFLDNQQHRRSSKRLWGSILLGSGAFLSFYLFFAAIFFGVQNAGVAEGIIHTFFYAGGGLLGVGVFENLKIKG
jgi:hypothetical protein